VAKPRVIAGFNGATARDCVVKPSARTLWKIARPFECLTRATMASLVACARAYRIALADLFIERRKPP